MSRHERAKSKSGYYHIMIRGNERVEQGDRYLVPEVKVEKVGMKHQ